ncbi:hypothetical protein MAR_019745 [Mya arenaria]|uniref:Cadherin domain-containing protein n=1 Tax=Mya arenaria TaxID=6604 RepID=A0ABY7EB32_MYAAR|nr:hypothetical protein MAR_019745 [Mya arenaria]
MKYILCVAIFWSLLKSCLAGGCNDYTGYRYLNDYDLAENEDDPSETDFFAGGGNNHYELPVSSEMWIPVQQKDRLAFFTEGYPMITFQNGTSSSQKWNTGQVFVDTGGNVAVSSEGDKSDNRYAVAAYIEEAHEPMFVNAPFTVTIFTHDYVSSPVIFTATVLDLDGTDILDVTMNGTESVKFTLTDIYANSIEYDGTGLEFATKKFYDIVVNCNDGVSTVTSNFQVDVIKNEPPSYNSGAGVLPGWTAVDRSSESEKTIYTLNATDPNGDTLVFTRDSCTSLNGSSCDSYIEVSSTGNLTTKAVLDDVGYDVEDPYTFESPVTFVNLDATIHVLEGTAEGTYLYKVMYLDENPTENFTLTATANATTLTHFDFNTSMAFANDIDGDTVYYTMDCGDDSKYFYFNPSDKKSPSDPFFTFIADMTASDGDINDTPDTLTFSNWCRRKPKPKVPRRTVGKLTVTVNRKTLENDPDNALPWELLAKDNDVPEVNEVQESIHRRQERRDRDYKNVKGLAVFEKGKGARPDSSRSGSSASIGRSSESPQYAKFVSKADGGEGQWGALS